MHAPADRTAKRLSTEEWFFRYDAADIAKRQATPPPQAMMRAPADRTAQRK